MYAFLLRRSREFRLFLRYTSLSDALRIVDVCARCVHRCKAQSRPRLPVPLHSCCFYTWRCNLLPKLLKQWYKLRSGRRRKQQHLRVLSVTDHAGCLCEWKVWTLLLRRSGDFRFCLRFTSLSAALRIVDLCARCVHRCKAQSRPRVLVLLHSCCFYTWLRNPLPKLHKQWYKLRFGRRRKQQNLRV